MIAWCTTFSFLCLKNAEAHGIYSCEGGFFLRHSISEVACVSGEAGIAMVSTPASNNRIWELFSVQNIREKKCLKVTLSSELTSMRFHFKMICPVLSFYCQKLGTLPNFDLQIIVLPTEKKKRQLFEVLLFVEYCNRWLCKILRKWPRPQVRAAPKAVLSYTQAFRRFLFCS